MSSIPPCPYCATAAANRNNNCPRCYRPTGYDSSQNSRSPSQTTRSSSPPVRRSVWPEFLLKAGLLYLFVAALGLLLIGPLLDAINGSFWTLPGGASARLQATPLLHLVAALVALRYGMPQRWAVHEGINWLTPALWLSLLLLSTYALGVFPPPSLWRSQSFHELSPQVQSLMRWVTPPLYEGRGAL